MKAYWVIPVLICFLTFGSGLLLNAEDSSFGFRVIVNSSNTSVDQLTKAQVSKIFLKKTTKWDNGQPIMPIDFTEDSPLRQIFSEKIHGRNVLNLKSYWQQMIFSGRAVPPPENKSEAEIVNFVKLHPGAIGYVSDNAALEQVKVVKVLN